MVGSCELVVVGAAGSGDVVGRPGGSRRDVSGFGELHLPEEGRGRGGIAREVAESLISEPAPLSSTLLVMKVAGTVMFVGAGVALIHDFTASPIAFLWYILFVIVLLFAGILPRAWVIGRQQAVALIGPPHSFLCHHPDACYGDHPAHRAQQRTRRRFGGKDLLSEAGLRFLLNVTDEESVIEDEEKEMIARSSSSARRWAVR